MRSPTLERGVGDLRWYFNEVEAAIGCRSNFGAMQAALCGVIGVGGDPEAMTPVDSGAARRMRRVWRKLSQLDGVHRRVLYALYGPAQRMPLELEQSFDGEALVAELTPTAIRVAREMATTTRYALVHRLRAEGAREFVRAVREEKERLRADALVAWRDAA